MRAYFGRLIPSAYPIAIASNMANGRETAHSIVSWCKRSLRAWQGSRTARKIISNMTAAFQPVIVVQGR